MDFVAWRDSLSDERRAQLREWREEVPPRPLTVDTGLRFEHPVKLPVTHGVAGMSDPIMSPRAWAMFNGAPITLEVERAEDEYRAKYGGAIVPCRAEYGAAICPCGAYALEWPPR